jgi:hypothetical protein
METWVMGLFPPPPFCGLSGYVRSLFFGKFGCPCLSAASSQLSSSLIATIVYPIFYVACGDIYD